MKFRIPGSRKKEVYAAAAVLVAGNVLGITMLTMEKKEAETRYLLRNQYGEGDYEEELYVKTNGKTQPIRIKVKEKSYEQQEIREYLEQAEKTLTNWILEETGGNGRLEHNLEFPAVLEQNPVVLFWSTDKPEVLDWEGNLGDEISAAGERTELTCMLSLGEEERLWEYPITVYPEKHSGQETLQREIQKEADKQSTETEEKLYLPDKLHGENLQYEKSRTYTGGIICAGSVILGLGLFPLQKEKEKQKMEERRKEMKRDYPDIVEKLVLFLRAGYSIRRAVDKLASDYLRNKERYHWKERSAYEELVITSREMKGGVYEADAYERMGRRCSAAEYKMLSVLLVQNLRKGNQNILELLEREAASAGEERNRYAKVKGEEASTKLLLPMVLQLVVVLIILMVPAFLSFV